MTITDLSQLPSVPSGPGGPSNLAAPALKAFKVVFDQSDQLTLSWDHKNAGTTANGYRIAYATGPVAPADCNSAQITEATQTTKTVTVSGLSPHTQYSFRICSVNGDAVEAGMTKTITTAPDCDFSVTPGSLDDGSAGGLTFANVLDGLDSYIEFNNFMNAAGVAGDQNGDTKITLCLQDGLTIVNNNSLAAGYVQVNIADMVLFAPSSATVLFDDQRTGVIGGGNNAVVASRHTGQSFYNFQIKNPNNNAIGFLKTNGGTADIATGLNIVSGYPPEGAFAAVSGKIKEVHNVAVEMNAGTNATGAALTAWSSTLPYLSLVSVTVTGLVDEAIEYRLSFSPASVFFEDIRIRAVDPSYTIRGIGIESQFDATILRGDIEANGRGILSGNQSDVSLLDSKITTTGDFSYGLHAYYGQFSMIKNTIIETQGDDAPAIYLEETGSIVEMIGNTLIRNGTAATAAPAIRFQAGKNNFVDTLNITENTVCHKQSSNADWLAYLVEDTTPIASSTTPYDSGTNYGYTTFPWGDSTHAGTNPGYNLQTQWGGPCP